MRLLKSWAGIIIEAFWQFIADEGWAVASHIALSTLLALFPFLIVLTALASLIGSTELADAAAQILLQAWPPEVARPISAEIHSVIATTRGGVVTFGAVFAVYFSSNGIESLRIGLNRAYAVSETRPWWLLRLESIGYVLVGAIALLALSFLVVLGPFLFGLIVQYVQQLARLEWMLTFGRYAVASIVLVVSLLVTHLWLPGGRRPLTDVAPGVIVTLLLWIATGEAFGRYLAQFSYTYAKTYAGLASAMIALVFLYWTACVFIYGGELNAAIKRRQKR